MFDDNNNQMKREPKLINENSEFAWKVNEAVKVVETILDNTKNPSLASPNHEHSYNDKFTLSEFITNTAVTSLLNVLGKMGLGHSSNNNNSNNDTESSSTSSATTSIISTAEALRKLTSLVQDDKKSITMRFIARETCSFICENEIEIESPHRLETEVTTISSPTNTSEGNSTSTTKTNKKFTSVVKTKIKEYHWKIGIEHGIYLYSGNETAYDGIDSVPIVTNTISSNLVTRTATQPFSPSVDTNPIDVSLTWLLQTLKKDSLQSEFRIVREKPTCRTPRNNVDITKAWKFLNKLNQWCNQVNRYFKKKDKEIYEKDNHDKSHLSSIDGKGIFVPVLPLFDTLSEKSKNDHNNDNNDKRSPIISNEDVNKFLYKQYLTMSENIETLQTHFNGQIMSPVEASIVLLTAHASSIINYYFASMNHIEDMLCTQLYNAIGKHVSSDDLDDFVRSYNQKLFVDTYAPEPFCYAIRRPGYYPDGLITIEELKANGDDKGAERNAMTFTRQLETSNGGHSMYIPINSATSVQFNGNMYLHAWMMQRFQNSKPTFQLASRARQFSSFLLLVGKLAGPNTFQPEHGIILQNQDEVLIPLLLEEMPSAKEFKDAIESLSPEQQRFAKAFRSMKLSSSVFGVCVVQLKPQLEMLLDLPEKSLTKEIRLTQSLLSLFIDYQIPSDLLSFDGDDSLDAAAKVEVVKGHVKNVEGMIDDLKERDLKDAKTKADMAYEVRSMEGTYNSAGLFGSPAPSTFSSGFAAPSPFTSSTPGASFGSSSRKKEGFSARSKRASFGGASPKPFGSNQAVSQTSKPISNASDESNSTTVDQNVNNISISRNDIQQSDLTKIPKLLDSKFEMFGDDERYGGALRSTTIKTANGWTKKHKQNILSKLQSTSVSVDDQKTERQKTFDLLDALSRSGVLPMSHAELHVIIASTHAFDKSVVNAVVQDNINPIEKIERSHLLVASIIHNVEVKDLLTNANELNRVLSHSPQLMIEAGELDK